SFAIVVPEWFDSWWPVLMATSSLSFPLTERHAFSVTGYDPATCSLAPVSLPFRLW
ncbi:hypothetical protein HDU67_004643, partial [Dinochytrium kinnereticum]